MYTAGADDEHKKKKKEEPRGIAGSRPQRCHVDVIHKACELSFFGTETNSRARQGKRQYTVRNEKNYPQKINIRENVYTNTRLRGIGLLCAVTRPLTTTDLFKHLFTGTVKRTRAYSVEFSFPVGVRSSSAGVSSGGGVPVVTMGSGIDRAARYARIIGFKAVPQTAL